MFVHVMGVWNGSLHQEQLHRASDHRTQRRINPLVTSTQQFRPVTLAVWETSTRSRVEMCVRWFYSPMASSETDFPWQFLVFWPRKAKAVTLCASKVFLPAGLKNHCMMLKERWSSDCFESSHQTQCGIKDINYQFSLPKCCLVDLHWFQMTSFKSLNA